MHTTTHSHAETAALGKKIAASLTGGIVVCLYGEMGAGKTTFVKGIAEGLGITENITSPTFTLMNVYEVHSSKPIVQRLIHIDTYRLKDAKELLDIGVQDYLGQPGVVTIIEWPEKVEELLRGMKKVGITIELGNGDERKIEIKD